MAMCGLSVQSSACMCLGITKEVIVSWFETEVETREYLERWLSWQETGYTERGW